MARGGFLVGYPITRKKTHPGKIPIVKNPGNKNLQIFKNPQSGLGIFGDSKSPTLIPRISNSRGFFGLAENEKFPSFLGIPKKSHPKATSAWCIGELILILVKSEKEIHD